jgi:hypothetical protein
MHGRNAQARGVVLLCQDAPGSAARNVSHNLGARRAGSFARDRLEPPHRQAPPLPKAATHDFIEHHSPSSRSPIAPRGVCAPSPFPGGSAFLQRQTTIDNRGRRLPRVPLSTRKRVDHGSKTLIGFARALKAQTPPHATTSMPSIRSGSPSAHTELSVSCRHRNHRYASAQRDAVGSQPRLAPHTTALGNGAEPRSTPAGLARLPALRLARCTACVARPSASLAAAGLAAAGLAAAGLAAAGLAAAGLAAAGLAAAGLAALPASLHCLPRCTACLAALPASLHCRPRCSAGLAAVLASLQCWPRCSAGLAAVLASLHRGPPPRAMHCLRRSPLRLARCCRPRCIASLAASPASLHRRPPPCSLRCLAHCAALLAALPCSLRCLAHCTALLTAPPASPPRSTTSLGPSTSACIRASSAPSDPRCALRGRAASRGAGSRASAPFRARAGKCRVYLEPPKSGSKPGAWARTVARRCVARGMARELGVSRSPCMARGFLRRAPI